jgi:pyruvate-formate lyase-activating enzyme
MPARRPPAAQAAPRLLFADDAGTVYDHPTLLAAVRTGDDVIAPPEAPVAAPEGAALCFLPGRRPVGVDPATGATTVVREVRIGRRRVVPHAVGATLPPGWTRTFLPAAARPPLATAGDAPILPQWAYTAAALGGEGPVVWALHTDRRAHWSVATHSTEDLPALVERTLAGSANPIYRQLARCALDWRCFTAQNTFYARDEGAIPSSAACNASCVGCLSETQDGMPPSSHERIVRPPTAEEMAEVALRHLERARGRVLVSFGQGCEGEPLVRWKEILRAVRLVRARHPDAALHANSNGSLPDAVARLAGAGLRSWRFSLNSASPDLYDAWYRPRGYGLGDVVRSIRAARRRGCFVALNLLTFPGVTDREGEVERLCDLVAATGVDQVQTRPLALDPDVYVALARGRGGGGPALGVRALVRRLRAARPGLRVGNFSRAPSERAAARGRAAPPARGRAEAR